MSGTPGVSSPTDTGVDAGVGGLVSRRVCGGLSLSPHVPSTRREYHDMSTRQMAEWRH